MRYPLVFAYHDVSPYPRLSGNWVPPSIFRRHIVFLKDRFQPLPMEDLRFPLPHGAFVITFDDALEGVYRYAYPIMEDMGVKGILFVITGFVGKPNLWDAHFGITVRHASRSAIAELSGAGWLIGSHTVSHRALPNLPDREIRYELEYSKKYLEDLTGKEVFALAYPFNLYDRRTMDIAAEVGYRLGFAGPTLKGTHSPLNVPRIPVMLIDLTLRHKLLPLWATVDVLTTLPSRLTPVYKEIIGVLQRRLCR